MTPLIQRDSKIKIKTTDTTISLRSHLLQSNSIIKNQSKKTNRTVQGKKQKARTNGEELLSYSLRREIWNRRLLLSLFGKQKKSL